MSGRRRKGLSPSLFPFLAVLVCTLGTLILLLALVAENATQSAEQQTRADQLAKLEADQVEPIITRLRSATVASMIDEEQFRVEQLIDFRDQQTADLEDRRDQLTHLEDHMQRVREQLQQLGDEVNRAMGETPIETIDQSAIVDLQRQLAEEKAAIEQLRESKKTSTPRVVIVPHKGPNGTDRRPVYIECTASGVKIWPEGSEITMLQLEDSERSANPLDAALRIIRHHSMQHYGDQVPPYPLIVVRPDGIESYAAVRLAMSDWDDQFGYELVPAHVRLAFAKPDPALKERVELAIRKAIINQHARHAIAQRSSGRSRSRLPTLSAAKLDRDGHASGYRSSRDDIMSSSRYTGSYGSSNSYTSSSGDYPGNGSGSDAARRLDQHLREAAKDLDRGDSMGGGGDPLSDSLNAGFPQAGSSKSDPSNPESTRAVPSGPESIAGRGSSDQETDAGTDAAAFARTDAAAATALSDAKDGVTVNPYTDVSKTPQSGNADSQTSGANDQPTGSETDPQGSSDSVTRDDPSSREQDSSDNARVDSRSGQTAGSAAAQQPSSHPGAEAGPSMSAGSKAPQQSAGSPQIGATPPSRQMVKRQGRDWALPESVAGMRGNAIVRMIRVQCHPDRFVLLPSSRGGKIEMFGFSDGEVGRATIELATVVRDRVQQWGPAIPGGRWQPRLEVEIMPRGEARFYQLRTLMNGSGVDVKGRTH